MLDMSNSLAIVPPATVSVGVSKPLELLWMVRSDVLLMNAILLASTANLINPVLELSDWIAASISAGDGSYLMP